MHRCTQQAVMLFTLLTLPPAVLAGSTTYNILNHPDYQDGWTLSGTITTDGTIGLLQSSDITSWTWTVTKPGSSQTYRSTEPSALTNADGLTATSGGLLILTRTTSYTSEILLNTNHGGINDGYGYIGGGATAAPTYYTGAGGVLQSGLYAFYWSEEDPPNPVSVPQEEFTFASTTAVPEPSTLYLLGFGAVCGSVYVMGHKVMGHKRRERRTATTA